MKLLLGSRWVYREDILRFVRVIAAGLLAVAMIVVALVWWTTPSVEPGQFRLPPETEFSKGRYAAYVGPWGGKLFRLTRPWSSIADAEVIDHRTFPKETRMVWRWPPFAPKDGPGVWGYNFIAYDNYVGNPVEQATPPVRVRDLKDFRQAFRWSIENRWGDANVLTEFYLRSSTTDVEANVIEVGWFLHAPASMRAFLEASPLIGTYVDPAGRRWIVRKADKYTMFAPVVPADTPAGQIDMLAALRWLEAQKLITGDEWLWGVAIGAEPVTGFGNLTVHHWQVVRR